jgi:hypothetical protein
MLNATMTLKPRKLVAKKTNGQIFRALLKANDMTIPEAAALLKRQPRTVEKWLQDANTSSHRRMRDDTLEVFKMRLEKMAARNVG